MALYHLALAWLDFFHLVPEGLLKVDSRIYQQSKQIGCASARSCSGFSVGEYSDPA